MTTTGRSIVEMNPNELEHRSTGFLRTVEHADLTIEGERCQLLNTGVPVREDGARSISGQEREDSSKHPAQAAEDFPACQYSTSTAVAG
jgi:hypothetical protein